MKTKKIISKQLRQLQDTMYYDLEQTQKLWAKHHKTFSN